MEKSNERERHESKCLQNKGFFTGGRKVYSHSAKFPYSVCGKEVGKNSEVPKMQKMNA